MIRTSAVTSNLTYPSFAQTQINKGTCCTGTVLRSAVKYQTVLPTIIRPTVPFPTVYLLQSALPEVSRLYTPLSTKILCCPLVNVNILSKHIPRDTRVLSTV